MFSKKVDLRVFTDVSWWHWALTIPLLAAHLAGYSWAMLMAMGLCASAGVYFLLRLRRLRPYPVQVRIFYLGLLLIGTLPWMQWVHWVQLIGTTAMVTVGYCPLIRILSLLPLNRTEPLTPALVWRVFVREPRAGGIISRSTGSLSPAIGCCSIPTGGAPLACSLPNRQSPPEELHRVPVH